MAVVVVFDVAKEEKRRDAWFKREGGSSDESFAIELCIGVERARERGRDKEHAPWLIGRRDGSISWGLTI